jgi:hypothetical protein
MQNIYVKDLYGLYFLNKIHLRNKVLKGNEK